MPTKLTKTVTRESTEERDGRPIIVSLTVDQRIEMRLKGKKMVASDRIGRLWDELVPAAAAPAPPPAAGVSASAAAGDGAAAVASAELTQAFNKIAGAPSALPVAGSVPYRVDGDTLFIGDPDSAWIRVHRGEGRRIYISDQLWRSQQRQRQLEEK